jgi:hypothetical protein
VTELDAKDAHGKTSREVWFAAATNGTCVASIPSSATRVSVDSSDTDDEDDAEFRESRTRSKDDDGDDACPEVVGLVETGLILTETRTAVDDDDDKGC